jgi:hypothetical protein
MKAPSRTTKGISFQPLVYLKCQLTSSHVWILSFILTVALTLGMIGLDHGLPYFPDADEPYFVRCANRIANLHQSPGWFGHPGSTLIYPLAFIYKLWGSVSYRIPIWQTNPDLFELLKEDMVKAEHFETDWAVYYLIGRWFNLFYFAAGIVTTYLVGVRVWDKRAALLAAWFMAITPELISHAQVVRTDHAGLLFYMLGFLACFRLLSSRKWYDYAIAGIAIGTAGSSRYFDLSLGATLVLVHSLSGAHRERGHWKRLIIGLTAIGVGFLITTPAFIFSIKTVYRQLRLEAHGAWIPLTLPGKLWWYLSFALPNALTWPIWLLAIVGMFLVWHGRNRRAIPLLSGFIMFLLTIIVPSWYWQRWIIPLVPIGLLFAARALWTGIDALMECKPGFARWGKSVAILLITAMSIVPLKGSIRHVYLMTQPDTRTLAAQWIEANVPPGSRIARERFTPLIPGDGLFVTYIRYLYELELFDETLAPRYDYLVTSSDVYEFFFKVASLRSERVESCEEQAKFYEELFENELIAEFEPDPWKTPGPTIRIYRIPN